MSFITLIDCLLGCMEYHVKIPLRFEKISFRSESISWEMTIYVEICMQWICLYRWKCSVSLLGVGRPLQVAAPASGDLLHLLL